MSSLQDEIKTRFPEIVFDEANRDKAVPRLMEVINVDRKKVKSTMVSRRGLYSKYEGGAIEAKKVLTKLQSFAEAQGDLPAVLKDMLVFLDQPEGIDFGDAEVQRLLTVMAVMPGAPITVEESNKLKALALQTSVVSEDELKRALWSDSGEWLLGE